MIKLLDTNICSYILRKQPISAIGRFKIQEPNSLYLSSIVVAELRFGARKLNASRFTSQVEAWIGAQITCALIRKNIRNGLQT